MKHNTIIIFDGLCNLCSAAVQFVIYRDPQEKFRFVSFQSDAGRKLVNDFTNVSNNPETVILIKDNQAYYKSDAALHIAKELSGLWKYAFYFKAVPRPVRDSIYGFIAQKRYKWFGKRDICLVPAPEIRERFIE